MTATAEFAALLPPVWPAYGVKGVGPEDLWAQASLDLYLKALGHHRDPKVTGSAKAIAAAGSPYNGSGNHETSERCVHTLRDGDPKPLLESLTKQLDSGHLCLANRDETLSPYRGFYQRDYLVALRVTVSAKLATEIRRWLSHERWLLEACEWPVGSGDVYSPGLRWHPGQACPEHRLSGFLKAIRGESVDTKHRLMGHSKGSKMNGGMPIESNVWAALIAREAGLLKCVEPIAPKLAAGYNLHVERDKTGIRAWLEGAGKSDPITVRLVEMRQGWEKPLIEKVA